MLSFMRKRKIVSALIVLFLLMSAWIYHFVIDGSIPSTSTYEFDISEIRSLADAPVDALPTEIRFEVITHTPAPYFAIRAGGGFRRVTMVRPAFQIITPAGHYALESGMDFDLAEQFNQSENFDEAAWAATQDMVSGALGVMVTHEHPDHVGGVVRHNDPASLVDKLLLTAEQFSGLKNFTRDGKTPASLSNYSPLEPGKYHRIAPGIVMIRAGGHTPGSVIYYIRQQNDEEFLFIGDIAYTINNVLEGVDRARFVRWRMVQPEDRSIIVDQLRALHDLSKAEPTIYFMPAHEGANLDTLQAQGILTRSFK